MGDLTLGLIRNQIQLALGNREDLDTALDSMVNTCQMRIARFFDFEEMLSLDDLTIAYTGVPLTDSSVALPTAASSGNNTRDVYGLTVVDGASGPVVTVDSIAHQSDHTDGAHSVALTGGAGSGATATVTVSGNAVTNVAITAGGIGYAKYDVLTIPHATIGGTGPVTCRVATVNLLDSTSNAGDYYTLHAVDRSTWKNRFFLDLTTAGPARPSHYCIFSTSIEIYPAPDKEYTVKLRRSKWPAELTSDEDKSELNQKDDLLIALTISWALYHLNNVERGNAYWAMFRSMVKEAVDAQTTKPDLYQTVNTMHPAGNWTNQFDSSTGISSGNSVYLRR